MLKPTRVLDYGRKGKEEQWVGKPGQRCAECVHGEPKVRGVVTCKPDNKATWGGALCARFVQQKK
jgi:hypothetical protein